MSSFFDPMVRAYFGNGGGSGGWDGNYAPFSDIPDSTPSSQIPVVSIGVHSFYRNQYVRSVLIKRVSREGNIMDNAFEHCDNLETVNIGSKQVFGESFSIGEFAFANCRKLKSITLRGVNGVEHGAFSYNTNLESVIISGPLKINSAPAPVAYINDVAFSGCSNLKEITMSVKSIKFNAFVDCENLERVSLSDCTYIGDQAFDGCGKLSTFIIRTENEVCEMSFSAFNDTPMVTGEGHIYVLASMYEYYRAGYEAALDQLMPGFFDILFRKIEDYPDICG